MKITRTLLTLTGAAIIVVGCGGDDRPKVENWQSEFLIDQNLVPTQDDLVAGGQELCDELVGTFREELGRLTPTPVASLDGVVTEWVGQVEGIVFDCPVDNPDDLSARYEEYDRLTAEVVAGLQAIHADSP